MPFAHPSLRAFKCIQALIEKHINAANNDTLFANLAPHLANLAKGIRGLERCKGLRSVFLIAIDRFQKSYRKKQYFQLHSSGGQNSCLKRSHRQLLKNDQSIPSGENPC